MKYLLRVSRRKRRKVGATDTNDGIVARSG